MVVALVNVNSQVQTHAQIHIHTQITAYAQIPALFQPHVPLQPSAHLHCNQASCPAMIPVDILVLAKASLTTWTLCVISTDSNKTAAFCSSVPYTLATRSCPFKKVNYPSSVSICSLPLSTIYPCFNIPDPRHPYLSDPRSHDFSGSDYYSSIVSLV